MEYNYFEELINTFDNKGRDTIRAYRSKVILEIGLKISDLSATLLLEDFKCLGKYLAVFDEIIENVSNSKTMDGINVFKSYFEAEYSNLLNEFKREYIIKYKLYAYDIEISNTDQVGTLYKKMNNLRK